MRKRTRVFTVLAALAAGALGGCGVDPLGPPVRAATSGYRAHVAIRENGVEKASFEIAVRGDDRRRDASEKGGPALVLNLRERRALRLDPATKTAREALFEEAQKEMLPGYPLAPGFDEKAEAARRGVTSYHRDSDEVFAGNACALWRFEDRPGEDGSPSTTYWVAPGYDKLVVRLERYTPKPDGTTSKAVTQLTNVRVAADPGLFRLPKGWTLGH
jgi:hypothetical protein